MYIALFPGQVPAIVDVAAMRKCGHSWTTNIIVDRTICGVCSESMNCAMTAGGVLLWK